MHFHPPTLSSPARDEWIIRLRWARRLSASHSSPSAVRLPAAPSLSAAEEAASVNEHGIDAYFPILHEAMDAEEAMRRDVTTANLRQTVTQVLRLIHD